MLASLAVVPSSWRKEEHRSEELLYVTEVLLICKLLDDPEPYLKTPPLTVNSQVTRLAYSLLKNIVYIASVASVKGDGRRIVFFSLSRPSFVFVFFLQCVATQLSDYSQINYSHQGKVSKQPHALLFISDNFFLRCSYGYPDPSYIDRVRKQLAEKGITSSYKSGNSTTNLDFHV